MNHTEPEEELINVGEAVRYTGLTKARINVLSNQGRLGRRIGGYWLYTRAELDDYLHSDKSKGGRPLKRDETDHKEAAVGVV